MRKKSAMTPMRIFCHDLALHLHMPVGLMLQAMSARELLDWSTYFQAKAARSATDANTLTPDNADALDDAALDRMFGPVGVR